MDFDKLYLRALKFLNFRPRSEKEVRDYLEKIIKKSKAEIGGEIDLIIHKLKQQKFLNDEEFARWLVRSRTEFKPKGEYLVKQELKQKGVSNDIIGHILYSKSEEGKSQQELAVLVLLGKKKKYEYMEPKERFSKAGSMLGRRGFDLDTIKRAIDQVFEKMI